MGNGTSVTTAKPDSQPNFSFRKSPLLRFQHWLSKGHAFVGSVVTLGYVLDHAKFYTIALLHWTNMLYEKPTTLSILI